MPEAMRDEVRKGLLSVQPTTPSSKTGSPPEWRKGFLASFSTRICRRAGRLCFVGQSARQAGRMAAGLLYQCVSVQRFISAAVGNFKFDGRKPVKQAGFMWPATRSISIGSVRRLICSGAADFSISRNLEQQRGICPAAARSSLLPNSARERALTAQSIRSAHTIEAQNQSGSP